MAATLMSLEGVPPTAAECLPLSKAPCKPAVAPTLEEPSKDCPATQGPGKPRPAIEITDGWPCTCNTSTNTQTSSQTISILTPGHLPSLLFQSFLPSWAPRAPCPIPHGLSPTPTHVCVWYMGPQAQKGVLFKAPLSPSRNPLSFLTERPLVLILQWGLLNSFSPAVTGSPQGRLSSFLREVSGNGCCSKVSLSPQSPSSRGPTSVGTFIT